MKVMKSYAENLTIYDMANHTQPNIINSAKMEEWSQLCKWIRRNGDAVMR